MMMYCIKLLWFTSSIKHDKYSQCIKVQFWIKSIKFSSIPGRTMKAHGSFWWCWCEAHGTCFCCTDHMRCWQMTYFQSLVPGYISLWGPPLALETAHSETYDDKHVVTDQSWSCTCIFFFKRMLLLLAKCCMCNIIRNDIGITCIN